MFYFLSFNYFGFVLLSQFKYTCIYSARVGRDKELAFGIEHDVYLDGKEV